MSNLLYLPQFHDANNSKHLSDAFYIHTDPKQGGVLSPLTLNFALEYNITKSQENQEVLELTGSHQIPST
jgi:hypothetical protein